MQIAVDEKTITPEIPEGTATTRKELNDIKRGRGRPSKPVISELAAPSKFEPNANQFFEYLRSIPEDKLSRVMLVFYRDFPVCDETEGGTKDKYMEKVPGESHQFKDPDWETQILHLYGSGTYRCYLNEMGRTVCRCMKIETRWDLDNYPPVLDPQWLEQDLPKNRTYVQYLRSRGIKVPTHEEKEQQDGDMQLADTVSKLTDTLIARTTPVPQIQQQPSMAEKLNFEMATKVIDAANERMKVQFNAESKESSGIETAKTLLDIAEKFNGNKGNGENSDFMKFLMQQQTEAQRSREAAEARNTELMMKLFTQRDNPATQPKSLLDQMREMAEMRQLMQAAFGAGGSDNVSEAEEKTGKESIPEILIKSLPTLMQHGMGMWGQLNQTLAYRTRLTELETLKATGQLPTGAAQVQPPQAQAPMQQAQQQATQQPEQPNINPATGAPFTPEELNAQHEKQQKYAMYHGFVAMIAQPLINHLNDSEKDGFDFAQWLIDGNGRLMYDNVKSAGPENLMGAIESFQPLWQVIGGAGDKVKEFIGEFLTLDEMLAEEQAEGISDGTGIPMPMAELKKLG